MAMYRYENVQKGRLREFHQIGAELIGSNSYLADVETIMIGLDLFKTLNIPDIELNINSIGCPKCRKEYETVLKEFIGKNLDEYCETCKSRFNKNPLRILDCKEEKCKKLNVGAPKMIDYLCDECKAHFENVKNALEANGINYQIDSNIVRGLDYYTKTVFEFVDKKSGLTVLGGGRYDGLVEELGGLPTPAVGFGCGVERLMEMFEENNSDLKDKVPNLYILPMDEKAYNCADNLSRGLREKGLVIEKDIMERSFNSQMKYANKIGAKFLLVLGETEISSNKAKLKDMISGEEQEVSLNIEEIYEIIK
jgi:histidyl-tRNA synthetase